MLAKSIFKVFDLLQVPRIVELLWHLLVGVSKMSDAETEVAIQVLGPDSVRYPKVRVAEGRVLWLVFKINGNRAFTLFHTINLPATGSHSRGNLSLFVHEMVHIYQFEQLGSVYIWQALRAQQAAGYSYGGWENLALAHQNGQGYSSFNREQQCQIAQDYYNLVMTPNVPPDDPTRIAYQPFIDELQAGAF